MFYGRFEMYFNYVTRLHVYLNCNTLLKCTKVGFLQKIPCVEYTHFLKKDKSHGDELYFLGKIL